MTGLAAGSYSINNSFKSLNSSRRPDTPRTRVRQSTQLDRLDRVHLMGGGWVGGGGGCLPRCWQINKLKVKDRSNVRGVPYWPDDQ